MSNLAEARITAAFRLPPELHKRLKDEAAARGMSSNLLVVKLLTQSIEWLLPVEPGADRVRLQKTEEPAQGLRRRWLFKDRSY